MVFCPLRRAPRDGRPPRRASWLIPGKEHLTNDNLEEFIVQCWEDGSKPNVTQGHRYINHILSHYGRPPLNKHYRMNYGPVLDVLKGLKRTAEWREHKSKGAEPLPLEFVKKILLAKVHDDKGNIVLRLLRNKALASALILCGWHPKDAWEIKDCLLYTSPSPRD